MTHDLNSGTPAPPEDSQPSRRASRPGRLDPASRIRIGRGLRLLYAEVLAQPVPDRLERLVAQLGETGQAAPSVGAPTVCIEESPR